MINSTNLSIDCLTLFASVKCLFFYKHCPRKQNVQTSVATGLFLACVQTAPFPKKKIGKRDDPGGGGTPLQEANRDVPLDGVHFHDWIDYNEVVFSIDLLEWSHKFSDFWGEKGFKMRRFSVKKSESCWLLNLTISFC